METLKPPATIMTLQTPNNVSIAATSPSHFPFASTFIQKQLVDLSGPDPFCRSHILGVCPPCPHSPCIPPLHSETRSGELRLSFRQKQSKHPVYLKLAWGGVMQEHTRENRKMCRYRKKQSPTEAELASVFSLSSPPRVAGFIFSGPAALNGTGSAPCTWTLFWFIKEATVVHVWSKKQTEVTSMLRIHQEV